MIKARIIPFFLGFASACILGIGVIVGILFTFDDDTIKTLHPHTLPSGRTIQIVSFHLAWGIDHDERHPSDDCFTMEYVSAVPTADQSVKDDEASEAFELIRVQSELWGFTRAEVSAFPYAKRDGLYDLYSFKRNADGKWIFERKATKVHNDD